MNNISSQQHDERHETQQGGYYDIVIIGGGASGLMLAANLNLRSLQTSASGSSPARGIILEGSPRLGSKLLMSGGGHCNISHGGSIKEFLNAYGSKGHLLRRCLYKHSNLELVSWLDSHGVPLADENGDMIDPGHGSRALDGVGRIFPSSMKARDVLDALIHAAEDNGWEIKTNARVTDVIEVTEAQRAGSAASFPHAQSNESMVEQLNTHSNECAVDRPHVNSAGRWKISFRSRSTAGSDTRESVAVSSTYNRSSKSDQCRINKSESCKIIEPKSCGDSHELNIYASGIVVASGGITYPETGSDGSMFAILKKLGITVTGLRSALAQIYVRNYPYAELSGISIPDVTITVYSQNAACTCSGKAARSRGGVLFTHKGLSGPAILNVSGSAEEGEVIRLSYNKSFDELPRRMQRVLQERAKGGSGDIRTKTLAALLDHDDFAVERIDPHGMVTAGGVSLEEIDMKTMRIRRFYESSASGTHASNAGAVSVPAVASASAGISTSASNGSENTVSGPGMQNIHVTKKARVAAGSCIASSMYVIGEALDADGITGGYNLQLCWSTALAAADSIKAGFTPDCDILPRF